MTALRGGFFLFMANTAKSKKLAYALAGGGTMNYSAIGKKIRQKRLFWGFTQAQLAEAAEISVAFVGHIERGTRVLSVETLFRMCKVLRLSADDLLGL